MDHIKNAVTWAKANKQKSIAIAIVSHDLFTDQERISL